MRGSEGTVKRLDTKFRRVLLEAISIHKRDRAEPAHIGVVQSSAIVELEPQRRILELVAVEMSVIYEKRTGEPRLHDDTISALEIDHHQLCPSPAAEDRRVLQPFCEGARTCFAQHIALPNGDLLYLSPADRAVQIARDRLRFR